jgi:hypothetical protein
MEGQDERRTTGSIDIDSFLRKRDVCHLGSFPDDDGNAGTFRDDSRVFANLGRRFGDPRSRSVLFGRGGQLTVVESMANVDASRGTVLGRGVIGGEGVSSTHARVTVNGGRYELEDLASTNGTDVFKPAVARPERREYIGPVAVLDGKLGFSRALIGIGDYSVVALTRFPTGEYGITDATASRTNHVQKLRTLKEGDAITIGRENQQQYPAHLVGDRMILPETDIEVSHLRIFIKDGDIYICNLGGREYSIVMQGIQSQEAVRTPPPRPASQKPPEPPKPIRTPTAELLEILEAEIARLSITERDPTKLYRLLARRFHPDANLNDPNATRLMQMVNKHFGR